MSMMNVQMDESISEFRWVGGRQMGERDKNNNRYGQSNGCIDGKVFKPDK